jgi:hypothetical protein
LFVLNQYNLQQQIEIDGIAPLLLDRYKTEFPKREAGLRKAIERLCRPLELNDGWTRQRVATVLRDLLFTLRPIQAYGVNFSVVADDPRGGRQLRVYSYETNSNDDPPLPPQAEPVHEHEHSNRWEALHRQSITRFQSAEFIRQSKLQGERTQDGWCAPFRLVFNGRPVEATLSVDLTRKLDATESKLVPEIHRLLWLAARQLIRLSVGDTDTERDEDVLTARWESQLVYSNTMVRFARVLSPSEFALCEGNGDNSTVPGWGDNVYHPMQNCKDWLGSVKFADRLLREFVDRQAADAVPYDRAEQPPPRRRFGRHPYECIDNLQLLTLLHARLNVAKGWFVLPLHLFCDNVGYLLAGFKDDQLNAEANDLLSQWEGETYPPSLSLYRQRLNVMSRWIFELNAQWMRHVLHPGVSLPARWADGLPEHVAEPAESRGR